MVVMISGIILLAVLPAMARFRTSLRREQAAQQLMRDIRTARQRAVTGRSPVIVAFGNGSTTTNLTTYTIHTDTNGDRVWQSGEMKVSRTLPTGTKLEKVSLAPTDSLTFDISGILWPGTGGGYVAILSGTNIRDTLDVSATGMAYKR